MSKANRFLVVHRGSQWEVRREDKAESQATYTKKADAWLDARRRARSVGGEACIRDSNGSVHVRNTYGTLFPEKKS